MALGDILNRIADAMEDAFARRVEVALSWLKRNAVDPIAGGAAEGGPEGAAAALPEEYQDVLTTALSPADRAFEAGAKATIARALEKDAQARLLAVDFDAMNDKVREWLATYKFGLIRELTDTQRDAIRVVVAGNASAGFGPDDTARRLRRDLGDTLGLTAAQAEHVLNYRRELEELRQGALQRSLRDHRFDSTVRRAIETGNDLAPEKIDQMVEAYQRRYIAYRSMTIARTESLRASNLGAAALVGEAVDSGALGDARIEKVWIATRDNRTRDTHRDLNGKSVVGLQTPFITSAGNSIRWPHDPEAVAAETVQCRCSIGYRVTTGG